MNFLERALTALSTTMERPQPYGWFHIMFVVIMVVVTIAVSLLLRKKSDKTIRVVVLTYAAICLLFEVYKQLLFSYTPATNTWDYQWYAFPFQFCSTPMYVALVAGLIKKGKVQQSLYSFLATFGALAGIAVMIMPNDVFISEIGINIQTMIHHGGQVFIGIFLLVTRRAKLDFKTPLRALPTFVVLLITALILNLTLINFVGNETFNMFFISPHFNSTLPVFSTIQSQMPYVLFLLTYIFAMTAGAYLLTSLAIFVRFVGRKLKKEERI
ncbi:MAG: hypothetical protein ACOX6H_02860 [Christensenellales bacterium]|jgi:hypothetical protein